MSVSVCHKSVQWIELIFGMEVSFHLYNVLQENSGNSKNKGKSPGSLSRMLDYFASAAGRCRGAVNKSRKTEGDRTCGEQPERQADAHIQ